MYEILLTAMLALSVFVIIIIAMQPTRTQNSSNAFMGGAGDSSSTPKPRGLEAVLIKTTVVCLILFFVVSFALTKFF